MHQNRGRGRRQGWARKGWILTGLDHCDIDLTASLHTEMTCNHLHRKGGQHTSHRGFDFYREAELSWNKGNRSFCSWSFLQRS